jgi:hypothetical protein
MPQKTKRSVPTFAQIKKAYANLSDEQRYELHRSLSEEQRVRFEVRLMNDPDSNVGIIVSRQIQALAPKPKRQPKEVTKQMLRLRREKELSWGQIGKQFGISADAAMRRCQRAELRGL